jgi:hypothetical protein
MGGAWTVGWNPARVGASAHKYSDGVQSFAAGELRPAVLSTEELPRKALYGLLDVIRFGGRNEQPKTAWNPHSVVVWTAGRNIGRNRAAC